MGGLSTWAAFLSGLEFPLLVNQAGKCLLERLRDGSASGGDEGTEGAEGEGARRLLDLLDRSGLLETDGDGPRLSRRARLRFRPESPADGCSRFPFQVLFEVTRACNLRCRYCFVPVGRGPAPGELDGRGFRDAVEQLLSGGVSSLIFSGGEPLLRQELKGDLFWALELCAQAQVLTTLFTNGTLLLRHIKGLLKSGISKVAVSLDVPSAEAFGAVAGRPELFDAVVAGISELARAGVRPEITMVVSALTYPYVDRMLELAAGLGARALNLPRVYFAGASKGRRQMGVSDAEWRALYPRLLEFVGCRAPQPAPAGDGVAAPSQGPPPAAEKRRPPASPFGGCKGGRTFCVLHSDGRVSPCVGFVSSTLGWLGRAPLARIWTGSAAQEFRRVASPCPLQADSYLVDFEARRVRWGRA
ncbi:MAG: radical SAM protein [Acetobacteraceae bacterium]|nr:radical SAM protein [Acetobacteraceae bacterium]